MGKSSQYETKQLLGRGSFGKVWRAYDKENKRDVAIKVINMEADEADEIEDIMIEIRFLRQMENDRVTRLFDAFVEGTELWIVMEYIGGGSGVDLLSDQRPVPEDLVAIIVREMLIGLDYIHTQGKIHRDIKAANVLFTLDGQVKLADFGVGGQLSEAQAKRFSLVGTPYWMAPEVIEQSGSNQSADIWSLGITAIEFAMGEPPLASVHPIKALLQIPQRPSPELPATFSKYFREFVALCLNKDPRQRPTAKRLLEHKFIRRAKKRALLSQHVKRAQAFRPKQDIEDAPDGAGAPGKGSQQEVASEDAWDFGGADKPPAASPAVKSPGRPKPMPKPPQKYGSAGESGGSVFLANPKLTTASLVVVLRKQAKGETNAKVTAALQRAAQILDALDKKQPGIVAQMLGDTHRTIVERQQG